MSDRQINSRHLSARVMATVGFLSGIVAGLLAAAIGGYREADLRSCLVAISQYPRLVVGLLILAAICVAIALKGGWRRRRGATLAVAVLVFWIFRRTLSPWVLGATNVLACFGGDLPWCDIAGQDAQYLGWNRVGCVVDLAQRKWLGRNDFPRHSFFLCLSSTRWPKSPHGFRSAQSGLPR